jgi:hypothetical protein
LGALPLSSGSAKSIDTKDIRHFRHPTAIPGILLRIVFPSDMPQARDSVERMAMADQIE